MNYMIKSGDNLYLLSKKYNVSLDSLLKANPHIDPRRLIIGSYIYIPSFDNVKEKMRIVWLDHVYWTRLLIISIVENLKDENETAERLLRNPEDFAALFKPYYSDEVVNVIKKLMREHLEIAAQLVHAVKDNDTKRITVLNDIWYKNADEIASTFSKLNSSYNEKELRDMLYTHLDLTKEEVINRLKQDYKKEIEVFGKVEEEAIMMSDYFSNGISNY